MPDDGEKEFRAGYGLTPDAQDCPYGLAPDPIIRHAALIGNTTADDGWVAAPV
jgi:hypothetical protein